MDNSDKQFTSREQLGHRLKAAREKRKLTQKEVCEKIGIPKYQTLSAYETGKNSPPIDTLKALSILYGVTTDSLLFGNNEPVKKSDKECIRKIVETVDSLRLSPNFNFPSEYGGSCYISLSETVCVKFEHELRIFIDQWGKLRMLLDDESIDEELYRVALERQFDHLKEGALIDTDESPF